MKGSPRIAAPMKQMAELRRELRSTAFGEERTPATRALIRDKRAPATADTAAPAVPQTCAEGKKNEKSEPFQSVPAAILLRAPPSTAHLAMAIRSFLAPGH